MSKSFTVTLVNEKHVNNKIILPLKSSVCAQSINFYSCTLEVICSKHYMIWHHMKVRVLYVASLSEY